MYLGKLLSYQDNGKYNIDNWKLVFERMKKSKAKRLILGTFLKMSEKNDRPTLVKELSTISFLHLNVLNLSTSLSKLESNKICNI